MSDSLTGKSAIVTGGSRGIGRAIAQRLVSAGADVVITGRDSETGSAAAGDIGATFMAGHAGRADDIERVVRDVVAAHGRIDILVNNAATNPYAGPLIDIDTARWQKTFDTNLTGPLLFIQQVWAASMRQHGGAIINIASVGAFHTNPYLGVYDITKSALLHMTRQLAAELAPSVRVNAIAPGLVRTDFARFLWEGDKGEQVAQQYPLQRIGDPDDIAGAAAFLASDEAGWITGQCLTVDGGGEVAFSALG